MQKELDRRSTSMPAAAVDTADWESKYNDLKQLLPIFKALKADEGALRSELDVLGYTKAQLDGEERALLDMVRQREAEKGAEGFAEARLALDQVCCGSCAAGGTYIPTKLAWSCKVLANTNSLQPPSALKLRPISMQFMIGGSSHLCAKLLAILECMTEEACFI
jgi:hypothetical protein